MSPNKRTLGALMPLFVHSGHNRDDIMANVGGLTGNRLPEKGMSVRIQIDFNEKQTPTGPFAETLNRLDCEWTLMGGKIITVYTLRCVGVILTPCTPSCPISLHGEWAAVLTKREEFEHPWILDSLRRI